MSALETINIGIVGACGRGKSFRRVCEVLEPLRLAAVCDINEQGLAEAKETLGVDQAFTDYEQMLDKADLDAVVIGTPMPLHVPQAIAALKRNISVISEVPAAVSIDECQQLVATANDSSGIYMMAENYIFTRPNLIVRDLVRKGLFGEVYYAEGEYLHELKGLNEITKWRRQWQTGIDGITYGTHSLGPILQWFEGDRVTKVCCEGSGHHFTDPRGDAYSQDTSVMLCKMRSGGLAKIRVDMLSDRPHAMSNYQLQGTDGCYESARARGEMHRLWLRSRADDENTWEDLLGMGDEFIPEVWKTHADLAAKAGHGGGDLIELLDFINAFTGKGQPMVGIHEAMDMTLPGLVSQQSIKQDGQWLDVPDSREW